MAWLRGKVALGSFPDLAGAVNKFSESVKNFEKNFDNNTSSTSTLDSSQSWSPEFMAFVGQNDGNITNETSKRLESSKKLKSSKKQDESVEKDVESSSRLSFSKEKEEANACNSTSSTTLEASKPEEHQDHPMKGIHLERDKSAEKHVDTATVEDGIGEPFDESKNIAEKLVETNIGKSNEATAVADNHIEIEASSQAKPSTDDAKESEIDSIKKSGSIKDESGNFVDHVATSYNELNEDKVTTQEDSVNKEAFHLLPSSDDVSEMVPDVVSKDGKENDIVHIMNHLAGDDQRDEEEQHTSDKADSNVELETLKKEMKNMEKSLVGAARQAQAKADEIAKLMNENEQLKSVIVDRRKTNEAEIESLREECHQRVSTMERKVYALTRERDTLRREQNKRSDAAALLREKDEIITQVMAEGEELSKKQAVQESTIRKQRAQIREFEEEKKGLTSKLQTEENKVESLKREKAVSEKLLQETIDKKQNELETQKEHFTNALNAVKEVKVLSDKRANDEARNELESHLREAEERKTTLVQTLEELRKTLSRKEHQAVSREDMLRKEIDDLQKQYHASERRCEELVMQVPDSTRPLLRQIEAMQETTARKAEDFAVVERSLNIQLQDAEAKAAAAEERDHSVNKRLLQTLSRINVLEAQISCLRSEQTQLTRSLEKERQRASESRQEFLALKEEADTHKGHVNQVKEEMMELKRKHKRELHETLTQRELLQQDMESEKAARLELEKTARLHVPTVPKPKSPSENGLNRRLSSASSLSSMEESFFLQASLDSSQTFSERSPKGPTVSSYYLKSMTPHTFQAALRQKDGELASYVSRLSSMETIRDSLSEELVKMTEECEKLRSEVALLPSIKAELEALRVRHSAALELMGERDEELEELRADIVDLKEMYREQVTMLVNKIQKGSPIDFA